ncbi:UDP-glucose--hexose-1-phosphate uridylyltransferase [Robertkochia sp. 1368]|nr:UDP-glucose--hexose-1-phosphate uridylyltransferase [Robertkochia sediminum]MBL7473266.1 UDP-glucose--hexose-1-phosphate uridylyltransferase [Robertkochia sediminum]
MNLQDYSHKRYNILTGEWVLVSPHRAKRPWQGQEEAVVREKRPQHDPNCYLCAGNTRINGEKNPEYTDVFVFQNDFAALQDTSPTFSEHRGLLRAESEQGICRVVCFSPDHSKSLADMTPEEIVKVVKVWKREYHDLGIRDGINYVQIFENKGAVMGCSNPHPHGQIWSQSSLPNEVLKKDNRQAQYYREHQRSLLGDYIQQELELGERILFENEHFAALVPFWAIWPFETMIVPKKHLVHLGALNDAQEAQLAEAISVITKVYDKIFDTSFPYSSGIHQAPTNGEENAHWHMHMSFFPPLLRSATVKKFMVGYEMFGSPQRDITPEQAVKLMRSLL